MLGRKQVPIRKQAGGTPAPRWSHPVQDLQREINDMFENFFSGLAPFGGGRLESAFVPRVNVVEGDREVKVTAELPGLEEQDVEVSVSRGLLTLAGEKKTEAEERGKNVYAFERSSGTFRREIPLPESVDPDKAQAAFKNGVLTVSLPKRAVSMKERKQIPIRSA